VHVYSEVGRGTRFKAYFPAVVPAQNSEATAAAEPSLPRGRGELVLVVDDEEPIRRLTARTLEHYGYNVVTASHGAEAVAAFAGQPDAIAVVITDMSMPVMDGPTTIVALRTIRPDVKIIGCSGLDSNGKFAKLFGDGAVEFVAKPYSAETLLRAVRRALA
jgi:CheY-like chemotaxis protein